MSVQNFINLGGWVDKPKEVENVMMSLPMPLFTDVYGPLKDTGKNKVRLLYEFVTKVAGKFETFHQTGPDCVSMGSAMAVNLLKAVEIALNGEFEEWVASTSTEDIYGGSRIQIGGGRLGNGGGSVGAWAAEYVVSYGTLLRQKYGKIDLSKYDYEKARIWGSPGYGTPNELLILAKEHKIRTVSRVRNYNEARDAIYNGYPVTVASNVGFTSTRDKNGFLVRSGSWMHQMCFGGVDDSFQRPGLLCINSWGPDWVNGPTRHDQPLGSFWVDADTVDIMLAQNDSWVYSNFNGYEPQELDLRWV